MEANRIAAHTSRLLAISAGLALLLVTSARARADDSSFRWDIISVNFTTTPITISAGGQASALANDGSGITLTGKGTFGSSVTGGGTWRTFTAVGALTGKGTYKVTGFISFVVAPGSPPTAIDTIADSEDGRSGLAVLQISYSDGSNGILVVSCHQPGAGPPTTPPDVFEGITASKGFVDYWDRVPPIPGINANRTLFHVLD